MGGQILVNGNHRDIAGKLPMEASMRRFLIWSPIVGVAWYVLLFGLLNQSLNRPLNGWVHMSLLYLVPIGLLLCLAARLGLMTPERRTLPRMAMLLLSTSVVALMALQLAGMVFCVAAKNVSDGLLYHVSDGRRLL